MEVKVDHESEPQWYLDGGPSMDSSTDRQFTIGFFLTKEEFEMVLLARLIDGKSLAGLVKSGLQHELGELSKLSDYQAALSIAKQRKAFRDQLNKEER